MSLGSKNKFEILPEIQGKVLKAAREKLRLEIQDLATKACLSKNTSLSLSRVVSPAFTLSLIRSLWQKKLPKYCS